MAGEDRELINKYGQPLSYDRNFHEPLWRRHSCTDVPCLFIFLIFLVCWGFIAQYAFQHGDLNKLMIPTDSHNRKCGLDSQVLDKKYLFFFNLEKCIDPLVPITGCPTPQVCVKSCPIRTFVWDTMKDSLSFNDLKERLICLSEEDRLQIQTKRDAEFAITNNRCARWYLKSAPFLNRCMWEFSPEVCDFIPSVLLQRNRREINSYNQTDGTKETQLQALALALTTSEELKGHSDLQMSIQGEAEVQCRRRTKQDEAAIKEKMLKTDTKLAKMVGNLVAHFYNGTRNAQQIGEEVAEDILNSWQVVLAALLCTLVASLILIALMRWLAAPITWASILGVLGGLIYGLYYCITQFIFWKNYATVPDHALNLRAAFKNVFQDKNTWLYLSIFLCICFIIILLSSIILRKRIIIAIALTKEGSKAVSSVISTVFFPIFSWVLFIAVIVYAVAVGLYLGSIGTPSFRMNKQLDGISRTRLSKEQCLCEGDAQNYTVGTMCDPAIFQNNCYNPDNSGSGLFSQLRRSPCMQTSCSFVNIKHPTMISWFIFYNVFGFFWLVFFISAFSDMVLAGTFANWYWTFNKKDVPCFTLTRAFFQTVFYHLGTLAFGSLILATCRIIRIILEYIDSKLRKYDNAVTRAILCCMKCFFWLLESFLRFINRNSYIMCAIHGKNFCASAQDAFNLVMRNFLRVVALNKVTDFLFFLAKVLLTGAAGTSTYYLLSLESSIFQLHYNSVPTIIVVIIAFLITSVFFSVYSMAVDTLFLCFLEDCERNDGTPEKPYYMSNELRKILGKRNRKPNRISNDGIILR